MGDESTSCTVVPSVLDEPDHRHHRFPTSCFHRHLPVGLCRRSTLAVHSHHSRLFNATTPGRSLPAAPWIPPLTLGVPVIEWEKEISPTGASKVTCHAPPTRPQVARCVVSACHQPQLWLNPHNELANWLLLLRAAKKLKKVTFLVSKFEMMIQFRKMDICQKQLRSSGHPYNSVELALHDRWRPQPNAVRPSFSGHRAAWIQRGCVAPASDPPASMPSPACVSPGPGSPSNTIRAMDKCLVLLWIPSSAFTSASTPCSAAR
ncbi:uncharacterized protein [Triticum aestivum]|uniref:uncharacterized protein isoform X3 n=1 Tax=Triticum aestivum TaxID=4565 RepID=UPI001D0330FD|nr:uncharacterized protein LOC123092127 isoform X3 [Triticum aestivum]